MKKIADLHQFIVDLNLVAAEQIDSFVDDLKITPSCRYSSISGILVVAEKDYLATFYIERYPHGEISEDALLAQICAWLIENDPDRLDPIRFNITLDVMDASVADIEFSIAFNELIIAQENPTGDLTFNSTQFALMA